MNGEKADCNDCRDSSSFEAQLRCTRETGSHCYKPARSVGVVQLVSRRQEGSHQNVSPPCEVILLSEAADSEELKLARSWEAAT